MVAVSQQRLVQGDGTPETAWQPWLKSVETATANLDDFLSKNSRLVVIAPHPDDEILACGGLMAMHCSRGGDVCVIAVTDGEASHVGSPRWDAEALAETRRAERIAGLSRLGLFEAVVVRLAIPDGLVNGSSVSLTSRLQLLLRASDVVVTTWRLDGHPDHDATGLAAAESCSAVGCRLIEAPVWMWHWAEPGDCRVPWNRLQRLPLVPTVRACKEAALCAHASQLDDSVRPQGAILGPAIVQRARRHDEYFFLEAELANEAYG